VYGDGGVGAGLLVRTDPWGNATCKDSGTCATAKPSCDDSEPCTTDACSATGGCTHQAASGTCDDGSACTLDEKCTVGKCGSGTVVVCDDGEPCTADTCDKALGCTYTKYVDGATCGTGKTCSAGVCK